MRAASVLKEYIKENGIRKSFVAEHAGIAPELLRRSLDGRRKLQADEFVAICNVLSLDLRHFRQREET